MLPGFLEAEGAGAGEGGEEPTMSTQAQLVFVPLLPFEASLAQSHSLQTAINEEGSVTGFRLTRGSLSGPSRVRLSSLVTTLFGSQFRPAVSWP